jgi:hypothetical protein
MGSTPWKRWMVFFPCWVCLIAGFSASCTMFDAQKSNDQALFLAVDRFNQNLRWEDYKSALTWIAPAAKGEFMDQIESLQGRVRIMGYQVMDVGTSGLSGNVTLLYRFYQKRNPQIQTRTLHQQWLFSEKDRVWQVVRNDLQQLMPE